MKVQRCHACGARYNADRLEVGTVFDCNRCGAAVTVEASNPVSLALLIAGFLVLGALFLWSPTGHVPGPILPWETLATGPDLTTTAGLALWALLGVWAIVTALVPAARQRSAVTIALALLALSAAATATGAGFPIVAERTLLWMAGAAALGAGLVLAGRRERGAATTALLLGGGLSLILIYATIFGPGEVSQLERIWGWLKHAFDGGTGTSEGIVREIGADVALLVSALGGILIGLGLRVRPLAIACGVLLAVALLLPGAVRLGEGFESEFAFGPFAENLAKSTGRALVRDGVALWAILTYAVADLVRARGGAS